MADKIKKGDHVEIIFIGRDKLSGKIFDLNDEETAKKENIHNPKYNYGGSIVCVGQKDVVEGLDEALEGKEVGSKFNVTVPPEKGFGQKDTRLFQLVPASKFEERPFPGMQVNVNGNVGVVKTVSGGRIMIDFNHPLAGRELEYEVTIKRKVTDDKEKLESFMKMYLNADPKLEVKEGNAVVNMDIPEQFKSEVEKKIKERIPSLKKIEFKFKPETPKTPSKKQ